MHTEGVEWILEQKQYLWDLAAHDRAAEADTDIFGMLDECDRMLMEAHKCPTQ